MFEREAEEYVLENFSSDYYGEFEMKQITEYSAFQKGAEFGYNKANEWHYVKDGLPEESISVLVSLENKRLMECLYIPGEGFRDPVFSKWFSPVAWIEKEKIFPKEIE